MKKYWKAAGAFCLGICIIGMGCGGGGQEAGSATPDTEAAVQPVGETDAEETDSGEILNVQMEMANQTTTADTIEVPISLLENDGFNGISLEITYDNRILEFQDIELGGGYANYQSLAECTELPNSNIVHVSYVFGQEISKTGLLAVMRFAVKENAQGMSAAVNVAVRNLTRLDERTISGNEKCIQIEIGEER